MHLAKSLREGEDSKKKCNGACLPGWFQGQIPNARYVIERRALRQLTFLEKSARVR